MPRPSRIGRHVDDEEIRELVRELSLGDGSDAQQELLKIGTRVVPFVMERANFGCPVVRYRVAYILGKVGDGRVLDTLVDLSNDRDGRVRYDAIMSFGYLGDERGIPIVESIIGELDCCAEEWEACFEALVRLGEDIEPHLAARVERQRAAGHDR